MLKIELATLKDADLILEFIKQLAAFERFPFSVTVTVADLRENLFGPKPLAEAIIFYQNETPCGFAVFYSTFSTTTGKPGLHLDDLFVLPEYHGQGIGKQVLSYLSNIAEERQCARFEWWALKTNENAAGFYQGIGADKVEEIDVFRLNAKGIERLASKIDNRTLS